MMSFATKSKKTAFAGALTLASALALAGCGTATEQGGTPQNLPYPGGAGPQWVYNGPLPRLENPEVVVSLKAHTARVSGFLPAGFTGSLPYYAVTDVVGGRTRVTVVYPIATGNLSSFNTNGSPVRNAPGSYTSLLAFPRKQRNDIAEWGGFPFLVYNLGREIGFHGPITHDGSEWNVKRGPVSHGCNRMQGEHLVEMAHLLGVDMKNKVYSGGASQSLPIRTKVLAMDAGFDTFNGQNVDVDYPVQRGVTRPTSNVRMFPTWDARELTRSVCRYNSSRALGSGHCDYRPANTIDIATGGRSLGTITCPAGYTLTPVGTQGGQICTDGTNVWGPFTQAMIDTCLAWGGGETACRSDRWGKDLAISARGTAVCPAGASYDAETRYCVEGSNAFGPFPAALVAKCEASGGGSACKSARWNRNVLKGVLAR